MNTFQNIFIDIPPEIIELGVLYGLVALLLGVLIILRKRRKKKEPEKK